MKFYKYSFIIIITIVIFGCNNIDNKKNSDIERNVIATLNNKNIFVDNIDSIIGFQVYEQRLNALKLYVSKRILEEEAKKQNLSLKEFTEKQINQKCEKVTQRDIEKYIKNGDVSYVDTNNIKSYLLSLKQKDRQSELIDSLKQYYDIKIKLQPPFYNYIETTDIYSFNLNQNKSDVELLIISDFTCPSCQVAEKQLEKLYVKYNNKVTFKFVYFSDYIGKSASACKAAEKQNQFKKMHDIIFENNNLLNEDSIYSHFATELNLNMTKFNEDMTDKQILKMFVENKERLISKGIYSTPTFVVNGKILDKRHSIDYLENVIIEELEK